MTATDPRSDLEDAFDRIEETILPCIAMMLESLSEAGTAGESEKERLAFAAELRTLALQLEALTQEVERLSPSHLEPGSYRSAAA